MVDGTFHSGPVSFGCGDLYGSAVLRQWPSFDGLQLLHLLQYPHLDPCCNRSRYSRLRRWLLPGTVEMDLVLQTIGQPNRVRKFRRCQQRTLRELLASLPPTSSVRKPRHLANTKPQPWFLTRALSSHWVAIGACVILLMLGFEPFMQALMYYEGRLIPPSFQY